MLISCKCLNFIATSNSNMAAKTNDEAAADCSSNLPADLMQTFLQRYPRNFIFYSVCMDFLKQTIGPITDLTINALNQRDLIYSLTLDVAHTQTTSSSWQLSICVNCNTALCAKRLPGLRMDSQQLYFINSALLTSNEELAHRRTDKSFSEVFGVLIMDHPTLKSPTTPPPVSSAVSFTVGSAAPNVGTSLVDSKQQRVRQLQNNLQQRLKREIAETDERIQRYTEQQFALLKSFREKSEQEYAMLVRLIQQVPEYNAGSSEWWLDRSPPALTVNGASPLSYSSRRRNTISSRRDLNTTTITPLIGQTTPTTPSVAASTMMSNAPIFPTSSAATNTVAPTTSLSSSTVKSSAIDGNTQGNNRTANSTSVTTITASATQRKLSNFDTPPATPESTPMSVGNSPTFRQQQQQTQVPPQSFGNNGRLLATQMSFQQQFPTPTGETSDDCIFELEGVESNNGMPSVLPAAAILSLQQQQYQRSFINQQQNQVQQRESNPQYMSDLDESDGDAEEAEDALDMEASAPITMKHVSGLRIKNANNDNSNQMLNYAKSLPIDIANSPLVERTVVRPSAAYNDDLEDDELDNAVDIAASIKALAKSVHGETVFGDLPRPRLRSQI